MKMMMMMKMKLLMLAAAVAVVVVVVNMQAAAVGAQTTATCSTSALVALLPCQHYFDAGNTTAPDAACCAPLAGILSANATCLCQLPDLLASASSSSSISLNVTRARDIASSCNSTIPTSVILCLSPNSSSSSSPPSPPTNSTNASSGPSSAAASLWTHAAVSATNGCGLVIAVVSVLLISILFSDR